jgi:hypothetical protein
MTVCLWADLDTYLAGAVTTDLGANSALYTTLRVAEVTVGPQIDEQHANLPAVLIVGQRLLYRLNDYGALASEYPYLLAVVYGHENYLTLKANLQELARRLRLSIWERGVFGGLASSDGERVWDTELGDIELTTWGPVEGLYYGAAELPLTVRSAY